MAKVAQENTLLKLLKGIPIFGKLDNGNDIPLSSTNEGHLETAIHDPLTVLERFLLLKILQFFKLILYMV